MPSKKKKADGPSKKGLQKKKEMQIADKTFGLKNKKNSKKVQAHVLSITKSINDFGGNPRARKLEENKKRVKAEKKAHKKAMEDERNALFGEALLAVAKKTNINTKGADGAKGRDHDVQENTKKAGTSRAMKMMFQMDAKEMEEALTADPNYVRTLEDEVELQRQNKLTELNGTGTPVTPESFKIWQDRKRKTKMEADRKLVEAEFKKKKGGKGLSILTGRALYEYKRDLFKDDEGADDGKNIDPPPSPTDEIQNVTETVQTNLFLEGDDEDIDDLDDLDDD
mmetsp:Transcript_19945/g.19199  ORF Transcript_19945/g.19199 Transcript_19945/m.19199 type:complete len:282 (-) Transcript_19945:179-1024(-)|eukprot:CAMPEP_0197833928 /NCGR_PEP_ID=MMETSP1437-20131217/20588_1 /TAXON_ID=49252 ORGANISM="Eucampia antarctica, Strain CCMP1452" /NCGR_SAMPLE_ID=MMETSP1437 /ASSEMBLY_ACC=CAM_ASM_001096 /LENGTH=281 /DNA_ID=CAMNT_0043438261 /DNA_START=238 /DNA_END=1083 /DNA_ORIENTATION=+